MTLKKALILRRPPRRPSRRTHGTHARRILGSAAEGRLVGSVDPDGSAEGLAD
jgi:hypothetical protein